MARSKTVNISEGGAASTFVSYIDYEDTPVLNLFRAGKHHDHYYVPPTTITIEDKTAINNLYQLTILIDEKFNLQETEEYRSTLKFNCGSFIINENLIANFTKGNLLLLEADLQNEYYYKPPKQILINFTQLVKLFKFLKFIHQDSNVTN